MNLFSTSRTIIPLITLMTGVLLPTNIALAASSAPTQEASVKQENIKGKEQTKKNYKIGKISQFFFSEKAKRIELVVFLTAIFLSIIVPELAHKSKKNNSSRLLKWLKYSEKYADQWGQIDNPENKTEENIVSRGVTHKNTKASSLVTDSGKKVNNQEKIELENQSEQEQKIA